MNCLYLLCYLEYEIERKYLTNKAQLQGSRLIYF